jgi:integrase
MAGHWRQRGNRIELRAFAGRDPLSGAKRYATRTMPLVGKREANKALAAFVAELAAGKVVSTGAGRTIGDLLERWFEARAGDWSPSTAYQTRWLIDHRLSGLRDRPVRTLDVAALDQFYAAMRERGGRGGTPLSGSSVHRVHGVVRLALDQAVKWGWRSDNPALRANAGKARKPKISPPTGPEVVQLLEAAEGQDPELLVFLYLDAETGARRGELSALRFTDFSDDSVRIARTLIVGLLTEESEREHAGHIWPAEWRRGVRSTALIEKESPKNESSIRTIALMPATTELVRQHRGRLIEQAFAAGVTFAPEGFVFPASVDGTRPWRPETWTRRFGRLRDREGMKVRLHDVRHFVATTLLTSGVDLATVAGRLGHGGGGKTTLSIYSHFLSEPDRLAAEVMAGVLAREPAAPTDAEVVSLAGRRRKAT